MLICSDLEIGDKIELYPYNKILTIYDIEIFVDRNGESYWRRIWYKGLSFDEYVACSDEFMIEKYGIKIIELSEER